MTCGETYQPYPHDGGKHKAVWRAKCGWLNQHRRPKGVEGNGNSGSFSGFGRIWCGQPFLNRDQEDSRFVADPPIFMVS